MATDQTNITEAISHTAAEAAKAVVQVMAAVITDNSERTQNAVPKKGRPFMKQSTFNWEAEDKNSELKICREVNNIFESYKRQQTERIAIIKIG